MADKKPATPATPATKPDKFETLADFQRHHPTVNIAEFLESVGVQLGLISRS